MAFPRRLAVGLLSPTAFLRRRALRRGLAGGNTAWMFVLVLLYVPRFAKRFFGREEVMVARTKVERGHAIAVEALPKLSKAERKAISKGTYAR